MKKRYLTIGCLFVGLNLFGQGVELEETLVVPPRFDVERQTLGQKSSKTPIYEYITQNIEYPTDALNMNQEGVVVVGFVVGTQGEVKNVKVINSVSPSLDECVIERLMTTSGNWFPGKVNGKPAEMESKVSVNFDISGNLSHDEMARRYLIMAVRNYDLGVALSQNDLVKERKSIRRFNKALANLEQAEKYRPSELAIVAWEVLALERLGDSERLQAKNDELRKLVSEAELAREE